MAGVSPSTVSLVLNGKGEISGTTRSRVLEVVSSLNYAPRVPRNRKVDQKTIKFLKISKHGHTVNRDHSHFISDYIDGMSSEATNRGYKLQIMSHENVNIGDIAELLTMSDAAGAIVLGTELGREDIQKIQDLQLPVVFIDTFYDLIDANFVDMNNSDAVYKVLRYLSDLGFTKIGFVGSDTETHNFVLRKRAFLKVMDVLGLPVDNRHVLAIGSTISSAYADSVSAIGEEVAQAYFCANDIMAYGFTKALKEKGYQIPEDVSVVGFDNLPMSLTFDPPLTTVEVSKRKIGSMAITVLDELIAADGKLPSTKVQVGAELVFRESTKW